MTSSEKPVLAVVIPCFNEAEVLLTCLHKVSEVIHELIEKKLISNDSYILFVDDGSSDQTWQIIEEQSSLAHVRGLKLSNNRGHQIALWAGLGYAVEKSDISISIDADLQDDIAVMEEMVLAYLEGNQVVYGVRSSRKSDSLFKKSSAEFFYKLMGKMGVKQVYNHADFRLLSKKALACLLQYNENSPYLRGLVPLIGFKSSSVYYSRNPRFAGESKYTLRKMLSLAINGITSLTVFPLRLISVIGFLLCVFSLFAGVYVLILKFKGETVLGWASMMIMFLFLGGIQLFSLGIIGEYIGKIYMQVKSRPKYFIEKVIGEEGKD